MATAMENRLSWHSFLVTRAEHAQVAAACAEEQVSHALEQIREAVLAGETTGDPVRDIVLCAHHKLDGNLENQYRPFAEALKGKVGEFALIDYVAQHTTKFGWTSIEQAWEPYVRVGVIDNECLISTDAVGITLPVSRHLLISHASLLFFSSRRLFTHVLSAPSNILASHYSEDDVSPSLLSEFSLGKNLYIGDEAVRAFLTRFGETDFFNYAAARLGKPPLPHAVAA